MKQNRKEKAMQAHQGNYFDAYGLPAQLQRNEDVDQTQVLETVPCSAVLEERSRLAREIHDTLTQEFAGILLHLEAAEALGDTRWPLSSEYMSRARELAKGGLEDSRRMLLSLRPKSLEGATLTEALRQLVEPFSKGGIACRFRASGNVGDVPEQIQDELYRVAQEALCNVRKHSCASSVSLSLGYEPGLVVLRIKDDGKGFSSINPQPTCHGYGLTTMRERAYRLGGTIGINAAPGKGTEVVIGVPLPGKTPTDRTAL
jgi:signal transduction histidine kinase